MLPERQIMMVEIHMTLACSSICKYLYLFPDDTNFGESSLFMSIWGVRRLLLALQRSVNCNQSKSHLCPTFQIFEREKWSKVKKNMNEMTFIHTCSQKCWHPYRRECFLYEVEKDYTQFGVTLLFEMK